MKTSAIPIQEHLKRVRHWLLLLSICFCLVITGKPNPAHAEANKSTSTEYAVKAAYIYNILRFVDWEEPSPLSKTESLNICLKQDNRFQQHLTPISKKSIKGKQIQLKIINRLEDSEGCHLIFIDNNDSTDIARVIQELKHSDTILLGNNIDFVSRGGLFGFHIIDNKVRLAANRKTLEQSRLKISSLLIEVCQLIGEVE